MISFLGAFASNGQLHRWCALLTVWFSVVASADAAIEIVGETKATFAWSSSEGAVAGYYVYVSLNGASADLHSSVIDTNSQTIHGNFGDAIRVSAAAFDESGNTGPRSDPSEEVLFVEAPTPTRSPTATPLPTPTPSPTPAAPSPPADEPPASETPPPGNSPHDGQAPPPYGGPSVAYDFNGDGHSDLLLHNATTGELDLWIMRGSEVDDVIALSSMDPGWDIKAAGDFDGNGTTDIVWYKHGNPTAHIWLMGDVAGDDEFDLRLRSGWVIAGAGDFDGDGRDEIAVWNRSAKVEIWGLRGDLIRLGRISIRSNREVAGFGDIDGDGDDDIIVQDRRKRKIEVSLMSADFSAQQVLLDKQLTAVWDVIDSGDYDGDGQSDLLWRKLSSDAPGNAGVLHVTSRLELSGSPLDLGADLTVVGSADYDGDGSTDLLVLDPATRELVLWLMAGSGAHRFESLGTLAPDWLPAGFNTDDTVHVDQVTTTVPEPSAWLQLIAGTGCLLLLRRGRWRDRPADVPNLWCQ